MEFKPWMLGAIDEAGYNGLRDEHFARVAAALLATGKRNFDKATFYNACRVSGVDPKNFTQSDLDCLERDYLNG